MLTGCVRVIPLLLVGLVLLHCATALPGTFDKKIKNENPPPKVDLFDPWVFNADYYVTTNPEVVEGALSHTYRDLRTHWLQIGLKNGLRASAKFSAKIYLEKNKDVRDMYGPDNYPFAVIHFLKRGVHELFRETGGPPRLNIFDRRVFNWKWYVDINNLFGSKATEERARTHWETSGFPRGLQGSPHFWVKKYLEKNPDIAEAYGIDNYPAGLSHWLDEGYKQTWRENGGSTCEFWSTWCHLNNPLTDALIKFSPPLPKYNSTGTSLLSPPVPIVAGWQLEVNGRTCSDKQKLAVQPPDTTRVSELIHVYYFPSRSRDPRPCNIFVKHFFDIQTRIQGRNVEELLIRRWDWKTEVPNILLKQSVPSPAGYSYEGFEWLKMPELNFPGLYSVIKASKALAPTFFGTRMETDQLVKAEAFRMEDDTFLVDNDFNHTEVERLHPTHLYTMLHRYAIDPLSPVPGAYESPEGLPGFTEDLLIPSDKQ